MAEGPTGEFSLFQPITTTLRGITQFYPPESCLRELLQNADDAGATEVEFTLDTASYPEDVENLLDPCLDQYQGPALLAWNNQIFSEADLKSLSVVGESGKAEDITVTGKFGRGFNSIYHWTDGPVIYSEDRLLFLDPHKYMGGGKGVAGWFKTTQASGRDSSSYSKAKTHLKAFQSIPFDPSAVYPGTIIRVPLRTDEQAKESKIVKRAISCAEIREALVGFAHEIGEGGLLFVKHLTSVKTRIDGKLFSETTILNTKNGIIKGKQQVLEKLRDRKQFEGAFELKISHFVDVGVDPQTVVRDFIVQHELRSTAGNGLDEWARGEKLFPWVAIAAPLTGSATADAYSKNLYCTLRLPIKIRQPLYLHGLWSIAPDRERLKSSKMDMKWNRYMFKTMIVAAWVRLLVYRQNSSFSQGNEQFDFWPISNTGTGNPWEDVQNDVIQAIIEKNLPVWNTNLQCVSLEDGFVAEECLRDDIYATALAETLMPIIYLRPDLLKVALTFSLDLESLQPKTVIEFLQIHGLSVASRDSRLRLLEYCLEGVKSLEDLRFIRFWLNVVGNFVALKKSSNFLPRNVDEQQLFKLARPELTIDASSLTEMASKKLHSLVNGNSRLRFLRFRSIADFCQDWPLLYPVKASEETYVRRPKGTDNLLKAAWDWLSKRGLNKYEDLAMAFNAFSATDLMFPLVQGRIRRFLLSPTDVPTLSLSASTPNNCRDLIRRIADQPDAPLMLDENILARAGVDFAERIGRRVSNVLIENDDSITSLVSWLYAAKEILHGLSGNDRCILAKRVRSLTKRLDSNDKLFLAEKIRALPLFQRVSQGHMTSVDKSVYPYEWCDLSGGEDYVAIKDLPAVPVRPGVCFLDLSSSDLARAYGLVKDLPSETLLKDYVVPAIEAGSVTGILQKTLIVHVLVQPPTLSASWKSDVSKFRIVPTRSSTSLTLPGDLKMPSELYDPSNRIFETILFPDELLFPDLGTLNLENDILRDFGIQVHMSSSIIRSRVRYYASCAKPPSEIKEKVVNLTKTPLRQAELQNKDYINNLRSQPWLPAIIGSQLSIVTSSECRPLVDKPLVGYVFGIAHLQLDHTWCQALGWTEPIELPLLMRQLHCCILEKDFEGIDAVLLYLNTTRNLDSYLPQLKNLKFIRGSTNELFLPSRVFRTQAGHLSRLTPYLDSLDKSFIHADLLNSLEVKHQPSLEDLYLIQGELLSYGETLSPVNLNTAIALLELASKFPRDQLHNLMGPDEDSRMVNISDLTIAEVSKVQYSAEQLETIKFIHPDVQPSTLRRLEIDSLWSRDLKTELSMDEDDDEYAPREELTTVITDTLSRYPISSTFTEYLANAEDCGATKITWLLDDDLSRHSLPSSNLLTEGGNFQGPALYVYNDRLFSENDFEGFKQVGRGSKGDHETSIGMFGRGAITMYHFTDVPMIISGSTFLILDPQQKHLPRTRRGTRKAGVKCSLNTARKHFPGQLTPFVGLFDYDQNLDTFNGTIFRFPLRTADAKSELIELVSRLDAWKVNETLNAYFDVASVSLIFLRNVREIMYARRGQKNFEWLVTSNRNASERCGTMEPQIQSISIKTSRARLGEIVESNSEWCTKDYEKSPPLTLARPAKLRNKRAQFAIAARIDSPRTKHNIYCTLPTSFTTSLPISYHGTFAVAGDRRSIPVGGVAQDIDSKWNKWISGDCIPDLYLSFLPEACKKYPDLVMSLWPHSASDELSRTIRDAFWKLLQREEYQYQEFFPVIASELTGKGQESSSHRRVASLVNGTFDNFPDAFSRALRPLMTRVCKNLVRIPPSLQTYFSEVLKTFNSLTPQYLGTLFQDELTCNQLERVLKERKGQLPSDRELWNCLIQAMVLSPRNELIAGNYYFTGCRILPLLDGCLGRIQSKESNHFYFHGTRSEMQLFEFAADKFVLCDFAKSSKSFLKPNETENFLNNPLNEIIRSGLFNIRSMQFADVAVLLRLSSSPVSMLPPDYEDWLLRFWEYFNPRLLKQMTTLKNEETPSAKKDDTYSTQDRVLREFCFVEMPLYTFQDGEIHRFLSPKQFEEGPYIIQPWVPDLIWSREYTDTSAEDIELCSHIPGLILIRHDCVPSLLRDSETNLTSSHSFGRLIRCISLLASNKDDDESSFLSAALSQKDLNILGRRMFNFIISQGSTDYIDQLLNFPVWPRVKPLTKGPNPYYTSAKKAIVTCHAKPHPWTKELENWIDPVTCSSRSLELTQLKKTPMNAEGIWKLTAPDIPSDAQLGPGQIQAYVDFLQYLANNGVLPRAQIAPNRDGNLCFPGDLYDESDPIFEAAFRLEQSSRFLHPAVQGLTNFWKQIGLRHVNSHWGLSQQDYIVCVHALSERSQLATFDSDNYFREDALEVLSHISWHLPNHSRWEPATWKEICKASIFEVKNFNDEHTYRLPRMQELASAQRLCSPANTYLTKFLPMSWSQGIYLAREPINSVYNTAPNGGAPSVDVVVNHLKFLIGIRLNVSQHDIPSFLGDMQKSYEYLNQNSAKLHSLHEAATAQIWLNIDAHEVDSVKAEDLKDAATVIKRLGFNLPVDLDSIKSVRLFLLPYSNLLKVLGCRDIKHIEYKPPSHDAVRLTPGEALLEDLNLLQEDRDYFDIRLTVEGEEGVIESYRNILACGSKFFKSGLSTRWNPDLAVTEGGRMFNLKIIGLKFEMLSIAVGFLHHRPIALPSYDDSDTSEILDKNLDFCMKVLKTAAFLDIPRMHRFVEDWILRQAHRFIGLENVRGVKKEAEEHGAKTLLQHCEEFDKANSETVDGIAQYFDRIQVEAPDGDDREDQSLFIT